MLEKMKGEMHVAPTATAQGEEGEQVGEQQGGAQAPPACESRVTAMKETLLLATY